MDVRAFCGILMLILLASSVGAEVVYYQGKRGRSPYPDLPSFAIVSERLRGRAVPRIVPRHIIVDNSLSGYDRFKARTRAQRLRRQRHNRLRPSERYGGVVAAGQLRYGRKQRYEVSAWRKTLAKWKSEEWQVPQRPKLLY